MADRQAPDPATTPDWGPLTEYVQESVGRVAGGQGAPKDFEHYVFESVMEAMYGRDIWKWWNARQ